MIRGHAKFQMHGVPVKNLSSTLVNRWSSSKELQKYVSRYAELSCMLVDTQMHNSGTLGNGEDQQTYIDICFLEN